MHRKELPSILQGRQIFGDTFTSSIYEDDKKVIWWIDVFKFWLRNKNEFPGSESWFGVCCVFQPLVHL